MSKESMTTWLDLEMGGDMTHQIEYGDRPQRMSMLPMCIPQTKKPPMRPPIDDEKKKDKEENVAATCSEKTEG
jgi:hypothetical protein